MDMDEQGKALANVFTATFIRDSVCKEQGLERTHTDESTDSAFPPVPNAVDSCPEEPQRSFGSLRSLAT